MKNYSFLLLLFFALCSLSMKAEVLMLDKNKDIILKGMYESGKPTKSLPAILPFAATLVDDIAISIYSGVPISDVTVSIYKDGVIVDQNVFSFAAGDTEFVSLDGYDSGDYVLVLSTGNGIYLMGEFAL